MLQANGDPCAVAQVFPIGRVLIDAIGKVFTFRRSLNVLVFFPYGCHSKLCMGSWPSPLLWCVQGIKLANKFEVGEVCA